MAVRYLFLPFKGVFEFVLVPEAGSVATNALLMETGDKLLLEDGNNIGLE